MSLYSDNCLYYFFKQKAIDNNYIFIAGQGQWTNLEYVTSNPNDIYLIYEENSASFLNNNIGGIDGYSFSGQFYLAKHDDVSTDYEFKKENTIIPMTDVVTSFYESCFGPCNNHLQVKYSKILELVNYLDCNFTGTGIDFIIEWRR